MENFLGPWAALEVAEKGILASLISNEAKVQFMLWAFPHGSADSVNELHVYRLEGGKAVEHRVGRDDMGAMRQPGVIPDAVPAPGRPATGSRPGPDPQV